MDCFDNQKRKNPVIPEPNYRELMKLTQFSKPELKELFSRFEDLASEAEGAIDKATFLSLSELQCCPVLSLIYDKEVRERAKNALDFDGFVIILDFLSKATVADEKAKCKSI
jgi:Ca2+-binding EF-hand superfamily protein